MRYVDGDNEVEIHAPPGARGNAAEAEQHRFIVDHWISLAAAAYVGFRRFGVGVVVVQRRPTADDAPPPAFGTHEVSFATPLSPWMRQDHLRTVAPWLEAQLETYDPRLACVLVFLDEGTPPHAYRAEATLPPPEAFERARALLN